MLLSYENYVDVSVTGQSHVVLVRLGCSKTRPIIRRKTQKRTEYRLNGDPKSEHHFATAQLLLNSLSIVAISL